MVVSATNEIDRAKYGGFTLWRGKERDSMFAR
jgi:hypothetical protein